jgi:DNA-binding MarR family transcriptional regulator
MIDDDVRKVMALYPRIFFACHTRHVADPKSGDELSAHQASILDHLDEVDPMGLVDLAQHMGVTPATMSIAVERLVQKGYVRRARSPIDTRRVELRLSAAGVRIKDSKSVLDEKRVRSMLSRLAAKDRSEAVRGLAALASAAEAEMKAKSGRGSWNRRRHARPAS